MQRFNRLFTSQWCVPCSKDRQDGALSSTDPDFALCRHCATLQRLGSKKMEGAGRTQREHYVSDEETAR